MSRRRKSVRSTIIRLLPLEDRIAPTGTPLIDSWVRGNTGENARIINGSSPGAGAVTTWPGMTAATVADVTKITQTSTDIYVNAPNFASYVMGPWYFANGSVFPNYPTNQNKLVHITLTPTPATTHSTNGLGAIGITVNGVSLFNMMDGFSWNGTADASNGKGVWNRDANVAEAATFDHSHAHQPGNGEYHYHSNPAGLRAQLGDNIAYTGTTAVFPNDPNVVTHSPTTTTTIPYEEYTTNLHHSPIIGWSYDGYPIYGPYGYSNPNDPTSPIVRMTTSYRLRTMTTRTSLPGWAAQAAYGDSVALNANGEYSLTATNYGPAVSATYPLGYYIEDHEYVSGLGTLDKYNGRFTKTPEYPNGTYAYFTTVDADGEEGEFPYLIGRQYYGTVTSGKATSIPGGATTTFNVTSPSLGGSIRGVVYTDADGSASRSFTEVGKSGVTVYIDANSNNVLDTGETYATTGADGDFELPVAANAAYNVRIVKPIGYMQTTNNPAAITVNSGNQANGVAFGVKVVPPPTVSSVTFGDGTSQRSTVRQVVVNFSEAVNFMGGTAASFTVHRSGSGGTVGDVFILANPANGPASSVTVTFSGALAESNGSLVDGLYDLMIDAAQVSGTGGALDGNNDSIPGGSYSVIGTTANMHFRLFGDNDGNGSVDQADYLVFRNAIGAGPSTIFDFDNNNDVGQTDYLAFRNRISATP